MRDRFFQPESTIWRVDREMVLLLGGGRALLMQLAHPKVAEGVADHSRFREDPMGRLYQTMSTMWSIVFDEVPEAQVSLQRVRQVHRQVQGALKQGDVLPVGTPYCAQDPALLLWVHATLIDSALLTYELFVGPLSGQEKSQYYDETKRLAHLLGVPESRIPDSLEAFDDYMREMIDSDAISVGATARALAGEILRPKPWILKMAAPVSALITIGLLPEKLRHQYRLKWSHRKEKMLKLLATSLRTTLPFVPALFRVVPHARAAEAKAAPAFGHDKIRAEKGHH